ncbi:hypothetical protein Salat_1834600 [Sesamum alatum]|uniref:Uncharacterized protein n=1 Tax=Sesamum alatum TaxID=300844 RepID=A0AAE1Y3D7_9LAMI|nr:hypothetical protein Salat_1834600 [Sesamum alatum]
MAKLTAAVALFCLFAISLALTPPENDDATTEVVLPLNTIIRLPTEGVKADDSATATSTPSTEVTFQPIDRHHLEVEPRTREHVETPYGDDMMVPAGENSDFDDPEMIHGGERRWVTLHHHDEASDSDSDDDDERAFGYYRFDRKRLKALAKMKNFELQKEKEDEQKNSGFMQRLRSFLGQFHVSISFVWV